MIRIVALFTLAIFTTIPSIVTADCHDSEPCEKVNLRLRKNMRWEKPYNNSVEYYINNTSHSGMPDLVEDTLEAAKLWTNVLYKGARIPFTPVYRGLTTKLAAEDNHLGQPTADNQNTVGWKGLGNKPKSPLAVTVTWTYIIRTDRIKEADICVNYYQALEIHRLCSSLEWCLRAVMAHEWGHFTGLEHVTKEQAKADNCLSEYSRYTMYKDIVTKGNHDAESLECEDLWAHRRNYQ